MSKSSNPAPLDPTSQRILTAAQTLFAQYGFQRTSMADIAKAAGISRPGLYLRFCGKTEIFAALGKKLVAEALARAQAAWTADAPLARNLEATILAKDLVLYRLLHAPHGEELLAVDAARTAALAAELDAGFAALLAERVRGESRLDLSPFGDADGLGRLVTALAGGLKRETVNEAAYCDMIGRLSRIVAAACRAAD